MTKALFRNARVFDGWSGRLREKVDVLTADGLIQSVSDRELQVENADTFECAGRVLMPGLIDAHVHVYAC